MYFYYWCHHYQDWFERNISHTHDHHNNILPINNTWSLCDDDQPDNSPPSDKKYCKANCGLVSLHQNQTNSSPLANQQKITTRVWLKPKPRPIFFVCCWINSPAAKYAQDQKQKNTKTKTKKPRAVFFVDLCPGSRVCAGPGCPTVCAMQPTRPPLLRVSPVSRARAAGE